MSDQNNEFSFKENEKINEKYLSEFDTWLNEKGLAKKTIRNHVNNAELFINHYLNYYEGAKMEDGIDNIGYFFSTWFIEKCMWSSKSAIKETAASIKKFYQCMSEKGYVSDDYSKQISGYIKEEMSYFLEQMDDYDNGTFYDW